MEKIIKLIMCRDRSIKINFDDQEKHTIEAQSRSITAEKLYEIMSFAPGNKYAVLSENEYNVDVQVLEFFTEIITEIVGKVNAIEIKVN